PRERERAREPGAPRSDVGPQVAQDPARPLPDGARPVEGAGPLCRILPLRAGPGHGGTARAALAAARTLHARAAAAGTRAHGPAGPPRRDPAGCEAARE